MTVVLYLSLQGILCKAGFFLNSICCWIIIKVGLRNSGIFLLFICNVKWNVNRKIRERLSIGELILQPKSKSVTHQYLKDRGMVLLSHRLCKVMPMEIYEYILYTRIWNKFQYPKIFDCFQYSLIFWCSFFLICFLFPWESKQLRNEDHFNHIKYIVGSEKIISANWKWNNFHETIISVQKAQISLLMCCAEFSLPVLSDSLLPHGL